MSARTLIAGWLLCLVGASAHAQPPDVIYCRQPVFRIPFQIDPGEQARLREVQLYVGEDGGRNWKLNKTVGPEQRHFPFRAERDGMFVFMVRTLDNEGRAFPTVVEGASPGLRVLVDTQLPVATLRNLPARADQVGIEWDARDDNLDLASLQIEYRTQGVAEWQALTAEAQRMGQKYWTPATRGPWEVRLRVRDRADNQGSAYLYIPAVNLVDNSRPAPVEPYPAPPVPMSQPVNPNVRVVNATEMTLNYSLEDVGPSGVSLVELWFTRDGRSWQRHSEDADKTSPFNVKFTGEGLYGLTLVVRSGVGLGDRSPQLGDPPQMWVEVDMTRPTVQIHSVEAGRGQDAGNLTVTWRADDKSMANQPISLLYAEQPEGPWMPMASGLDNTGKYVWRIPPATPFRFLVRVEAMDRGGNIGRSDSAKPVIVDLAQPKGRLLGVDGTPK